MADQLQLRGGTTTEHATFTGALREVTVDTTKKTLVVHDNATAGGTPLAKENLSNVPAGTITSNMIADGTIVNADISANAAIDLTKLANGSLPSGITVSSANITDLTLATVDIADGAVTSGKIADGTIVDGDVNASAAIAYSKLASMTAGNILVGNASNVATSTAVTGDVTISSSGVTAIGSGVIVNADVNASAAIAGTKISPDFGSQTIATTGVFSHALGTVSAPTVTFTGDTNTGIYSPGADQVAITTGGTARLYVGSTGSVGIGTSSPNKNLHIVGPDGAVASFPTVGAKDLLLVENNGASNINLIGASTSNSTVKFTKSGGSGISGGITCYYNNDSLALNTAGTDRVTVDSSGRVGIGTTSPGVALDVNGAIRSNDIFTLYKNSTDALYVGAGSIITGGASTDVAFRSNQNGSILFSTNGATERMRINSSGYVKFANDGSPTNPTLSFSGFDQSSNDTALYVNAKNASYASNALAVYAQRSASSAYYLASFFSTHVVATSADAEFHLRGDGQAYADGSWNGGGADYAEYFEWLDTNPNAEDRRGISVVLDGDKIREAVAGETPIGVISGNPSVIGDADIERWKGKYLRDDYGTYIQEDYEVEDEDGNTIVQQRRKLNPAYDPDQPYKSREERPEWDCVGLMGKLRIRKGQVTGSRWIKMRDVSDTVEEWLVR